MLYFYNMSTESAEDRIFKALAAPIRRQLLDRLKDDPQTTGDLCAAFEPLLQNWRKSAPSYVSFVRVPAVWNPIAELHARAYYTAEALGKTAEIDGPFFNEIHVKHNMLDSVDKLATFFAQFGVDDKTFRAKFSSFEIDAKVSRATDLVKRYKVPGTPAIVIDGKYLTNGTMAGTYEMWFQIIDYLAAQEHAAR